MPARKRDEVEIKQYIVRDQTRLYAGECETRKFQIDQFARGTLIGSKHSNEYSDQWSLFARQF